MTFPYKLNFESLTVRLHWKLRWQSFPFNEAVKLIPTADTVVDFGCGFGILTYLLAARSNQQQIVGVDLSKLKLTVAKRLLGSYKNVYIKSASIFLAATKSVSTVVVLDVLYLFTDLVKRRLLAKLAARLKPGGKIVVAIVPKEPTWQYFLAWLQEWIMVKLARKTNGKVINFETEDWMRWALTDCGLESIQKVLLPTPWPFFHKHVVFIATKPKN